MTIPAARDWRIPIFAMLVATFAVCTTEHIISGILPALAHDLTVDIPTAGLLITGYAVSVAVGGPLLALLTGRLSRRLDPTVRSQSGRDPPQRRTLRSGTRVPVLIKKLSAADAAFARVRRLAPPDGPVLSPGEPPLRHF